MTSVDHGVRDSWDRIGIQLRGHARTTPIRPAADAGSLDAVEAELAVTLPADVRAWWALGDVSADYWIPGPFAPVALEEALDARETWLLVAQEDGLLSDGDGEEEACFLPEFVPIAMSPGGDGLVVGLRPGEHHGAVFLWDHERWGLGAPLWPSTGSMLRDVAVALETRTPSPLRQAAPDGAGAARPDRTHDSGDPVREPEC